MRKNAVLKKRLTRNLKNARNKAGYTQEELADRIGVSRAYVGYLEQGRNTPSLGVLEKIARVLKVKISELV